MLQVFMLRDIKADVFANPIFAPSVGVAIRSFADEVNKSDGNPIAAHPEDYELYHYGAWVPQTGEFVPLERMAQVALGSNMKVSR